MTQQNAARNYLPTLSSQFVAGCGEAGRGPLAGPVVAAAVVLTPALYRTAIFHYLKDSKKLKHNVRMRVAHGLICYAYQPNPLVYYGLSYVSAATIDRINIRNASLLAMAQAARNLACEKPHLIVVDGRDALPSLSSLPLIRGDGCHPAIAAASILAKTARDIWMTSLDRLYPAYGFERHKGYGTQSHLSAIKAHGPCPEHRISFAPLKNRTS